jgi:hypothetical protein
MSSVRTRILEAVCDALRVGEAGGSARPAHLTVHRMKQTPIESDELPALAVYPLSVGGALGAIDSMTNSMEVRIEARCKVGKLSPDEAIDPLLVWIQKAIKADDTFEGIASQCIEGGITYDEEIMETGFAAASYDWTVVFFTTENDPEEQ